MFCSLQYLETKTFPNTMTDEVTSGKKVFYLQPPDEYGNTSTGKVLLYGRLHSELVTLSNGYTYQDRSLINESPSVVKETWPRFSTRYYVILPGEIYWSLKPCFLSSLGYYNLIQYLISINLVSDTCHSKEGPYMEDKVRVQTYYSNGYKLNRETENGYKYLCDWTPENGVVEHVPTTD